MSIKWSGDLLKKVKEMQGNLLTDGKEPSVKIGLPDTKARLHDGTKSALTLGEAAAINEFGTEDGSIPERPAWRQGLKRGRHLFNKLNARNIPRVLKGQMTLHQALGQLGAAGVAAVKTEILDGNFVENAPATIEKKGSSHPLIDTAQTRQSITWKIIK